ncbi:hypothetical protein SAMN05216337_1017122 [Bradyrhizobium brasilense]|uniref:Uncharacterized protein n=1 Tax=Bradyrhizobium brasilense TaxID=1419277 RepID=A0A1G6YWC7_9BRAD|nr:hypothetical protein [Bradyrhizobium brasilense]SDD94699.1 hypothetical protein SAMN05216337_1017122 [Bradyrhizobium brasilense]
MDMEHPEAEVIVVAESLARFLADPLDAVDAAVAVLAALKAMNREHRFLATTTAGRVVVVRHTDKGDIVPGYDKNGNRFEALTSHFRWGDQEAYSQVDRFEAERSGDVRTFRLKNDRTVLASIGIDPTSLEKCR